MFNPKAPLAEQIEFYRHEYKTAKTREMALVTFGAYMGLCRANARVDALEAALRSIANKCPATCDMTLAHEMAQEAEEALAALDKDGKLEK